MLSDPNEVYDETYSDFIFGKILVSPDQHKYYISLKPGSRKICLFCNGFLAPFDSLGLIYYEFLNRMQSTH